MLVDFNLTTSNLQGKFQFAEQGNRRISLVTDDKPITARQCIKALAQVGVAKPQYIPRILSCFQEADLSKYKDSMRPLIERDMTETKKALIK